MSRRPFEVRGSTELAQHHRYRFLAEEIVWPDGTRISFGVFEQPDAAIVVALSEEGTTFLVSQWRHSWDGRALELPAGGVDEGEDPALTARRELAEEAGLEASEWRSLGTARGLAVSRMRYHIYLARGLTKVDRRPEAYEQDMSLSEVPLAEALELAADGTIQHAASIAGLYRADRYLTRESRP
jgi:8-oxo-dGDP phosphatase